MESTLAFRWIIRVSHSKLLLRRRCWDGKSDTCLQEETQRSATSIAGERCTTYRMLNIALPSRHQHQAEGSVFRTTVLQHNLLATAMTLQPCSTPRAHSNMIPQPMASTSVSILSTFISPATTRFRTLIRSEHHLTLHSYLACFGPILPKRPT